MIKLFRNTRKNLLNEGKTSKYLKYAIGEIVLVVIGILIALSINNWNENRKETLKESVYLQQIHAEFIQNKEQFEKVRDFHIKSLNSCNWMIKHQPFNTVSLDSLRHHSLLSRISYTFDPSQSAIKSLISSGEINLIEDFELREVLISWQDLINDYLEEEKEMRQFTIDHIIPFTLDNFKLYKEEDRFDEVLFFEEKQLEKYLNLIARKRRILLEILSSNANKENGKTEFQKVVLAMDFIIENTKK
jgi:hypothetical protein